MDVMNREKPALDQVRFSVKTLYKFSSRRRSAIRTSGFAQANFHQIKIPFVAFPPLIRRVLFNQRKSNLRFTLEFLVLPIFFVILSRFANSGFGSYSRYADYVVKGCLHTKK